MNENAIKAQERLAFLEGFIGHFEGHELAPPTNLGTPLRKEWIRGWLYVEEFLGEDQSEYISELEAENSTLEEKVEELEADIERLTQRPAKGGDGGSQRSNRPTN